VGVKKVHVLDGVVAEAGEGGAHGLKRHDLDEAVAADDPRGALGAVADVVEVGGGREDPSGDDALSEVCVDKG
jgi:hypothetical protein